MWSCSENELSYIRNLPSSRSLINASPPTGFNGHPRSMHIKTIQPSTEMPRTHEEGFPGCHWCRDPADWTLRHCHSTLRCPFILAQGHLHVPLSMFIATGVSHRLSYFPRRNMPLHSPQEHTLKMETEDEKWDGLCILPQRYISVTKN